MKRAAMILFPLLLGACRCADSGDPNEARLMPKPPPPPMVSVPAGFQVQVELDGKPGPRIDAARLNDLAPDFQDTDHKAWRIAALIGVADRPRGEITITADSGYKLSLPLPKKRDDVQPALMLTRRGGIVAVELSPTDPFPPYHGQGRRLSRAGDPLPHVVGPVKIAFDSTATSSRAEH